MVILPDTLARDYVEATKVEGKDKVIQLLECCDEQLRKDLTRNAGGSLTNKSTEEVMEAIKKLAVRDENTMVARVHLHNMRQDRDETIRSFSARLRGQAGVCKFLVACPECNTEVNYTENVLRDLVTRGLADDEIQLDLLGDTNQNITLEEVLQFIEAKESGKRSAGRLLQTQGAEATRSQYRNTKHSDLRNRRTEKIETCLNCGKQGHGHKAPPKTRKQECPAYGNICQLCGRARHLEATCQSKDTPINRKPSSTNGTSRLAENASFEALCYLSSSSKDQSTHGILLDHHLYNHLNDRWIRRASRTQPFITLKTTIHPDDYIALGHKPVTNQPKSMQLTAMADTGCQSCLASMNAIRLLGLSENALIPVTTSMHAANNSGIHILGATILRFSGKSKQGQQLETRKIVYVTEESNKLYLSRETCKALGMISGSFPTVGESVPTPMRTCPLMQHSKPPKHQQHATAHDDRNHRLNQPNHHTQQLRQTGHTYSSGSSSITSPVRSTHASTNHCHSWRVCQ